MASVPEKVANPTQRILPQAQKVNARDDFGANTEFFVYRMPGDGDCGYHALGVSRTEATKLLLDHAGDPSIRDLVAPEIERAVANNDVPALLHDPLCSTFHKTREEYKTLKTILDGIVHKIKETEMSYTPKDAIKLAEFRKMTADQLVGSLYSPLPATMKKDLRPIQEEVRKLREAIKAQYNTKEVFEAYIRHYISLPGMELHCDPEINGFGLSSSLDAIAKLKNMTVILWADLENTGRLSIVHTYNAGPNAPIRNIQYVREHYNRLETRGDLEVYPVSTHAWENEKEEKEKKEKIEAFLANKFKFLEEAEQLRLVSEVEKGNTAVLNQYIATSTSVTTPTTLTASSTTPKTATTATTVASTTKATL